MFIGIEIVDDGKLICEYWNFKLYCLEGYLVCVIIEFFF